MCESKRTLGVIRVSLLEIILKRRSIRRYKPKPIPEKVLNNILEAGRRAPSAGNRQPWHFIVVTDQEIKRKLSTGTWNWPIKGSALTIVGCGYIGDSYARKWSTIDVTIALENMVIAAEAQGVGSCWIGDFNEKEVKEMLGIPDNFKVVALVSFGYPAEQPSLSVKKPLKEIVSYNKFKKAD